MAIIKIECYLCGRELKTGDEAFESEWKTIDLSGTDTVIHLVKKYECAPACLTEAAS